MSRRKAYDFIVCGAGPSAAAWLRSTLRQSPGARILLLERGPYCKTDILTEKNPFKLLKDTPRILAKYQHDVVQGAVLGGGTSVNNYAWITPSKHDEEAGVTGAHDNVLRSRLDWYAQAAARG